MHISTDDGRKFTLIAQTDEDRYFIGTLAQDGHAQFTGLLPASEGAAPGAAFVQRGCTVVVGTAATPA